MTITVDLGGTKISAALYTHGTLQHRTVLPTPEDRHPEAIVAVLTPLLQALRAKGGDRVAVAATGRVRAGRVTALNTSTMPGWTDFDFQRALERALNLPVLILNDADAAAYAEAVKGAGQDLRDFLFMTVSTGIGAGLILKRQLFRSASGLHADVGFMRGQMGVPLEHLAGGRALDAWAREHGHDDGARGLLAVADRPGPEADYLDQVLQPLVTCLGDVRVLLGIDHLILGGSVGLNPVFCSALSRALQAQPPLYRLALHAAALGPDAGLYGAALYAEAAEAEPA